MTNLNYTMQNGYNLPNLILPPQPEVTLGKYGRMRRKYLEEHRKVFFLNLLTSCTLNEHLLEIQETATQRMEQLTQQMAKTEDVTESLKASDPMRWTGLMNNIRHRAEETVLAELVYS